ncbi:hypothetical protein NXF25_008606 [Crotalus adamanteus]|uniref:Uncharacterized protein n=1 Tax=Crotalus adamanteus TaxID=8729 RepID=A0AAW1BNW2_CROAD
MCYHSYHNTKASGRNYLTIIPLGQQAEQRSTRPVLLAPPQPADNEFNQKLREALEGDKWFRNHKEDMMMKEDLAWKGSKLYMPLNLSTQILKFHDVKPACHFGFVKTLHLARRQFW